MSEIKKRGRPKKEYTPKDIQRKLEQKRMLNRKNYLERKNMFSEIPETKAPEIPETKAPEIPETKAPEIPETKAPEIPETKGSETENINTEDFKVSIPEIKNDIEPPEYTKTDDKKVIKVSFIGSIVAKIEEFIVFKYTNEPLTSEEYDETTEVINDVLSNRIQIVNKYADIINVPIVLGSHFVKRIHFRDKDNQTNNQTNNQTINYSSGRIPGQPFKLKNGVVIE